jgi:hypothetical protein
MATQQANPGCGIGAIAGLMKIVVDAHAACLVPFLRTRFGVEGIGISGLLAFVLILLYAELARAPEMIVFFAVWLAALVYQRVQTLRLVWAGWREHSRYTGWPWLAFRLVPGLHRHSTAKLVVEPFVCLAVGWLLREWSDALGRFVMLGGLSILLSTAIDLQAVRMRLRQMQDAELTMRQLARWHRRGGMDD